MGLMNKKKDIKEVEVVETVITEPVVVDPVKPVELVEAVTQPVVEPDVKIVEDIKEVEPAVRPRNVSKKVTLQTGENGITDLRVPFGYNTTWGEDKVVTQRVAAKTRIEIAIPDECDLNKWVSYYKQLSTLGVRVIQFGTFEEA